MSFLIYILSKVGPFVKKCWISSQLTVYQVTDERIHKREQVVSNYNNSFTSACIIYSTVHIKYAFNMRKFGLEFVTEKVNNIFCRSPFHYYSACYMLTLMEYLIIKFCENKFFIISSSIAWKTKSFLFNISCRNETLIGFDIKYFCTICTILKKFAVKVSDHTCWFSKIFFTSVLKMDEKCHLRCVFVQNIT